VNCAVWFWDLSCSHCRPNVNYVKVRISIVCLCHLLQWLLAFTDTSTADTSPFQGHTWWWQLDASSSELSQWDPHSFLSWINSPQCSSPALDWRSAIVICRNVGCELVALMDKLVSAREINHALHPEQVTNGVPNKSLFSQQKI
jgi:hypothetical protein